MSGNSSLLMRHIAFTTVSGVPLFLQRVPVLGGLLRGISMRAISRLLEDVNSAVSLVRVRAGYPGCYIIMRTLNTVLIAVGQSAV